MNLLKIKERLFLTQSNLHLCAPWGGWKYVLNYRVTFLLFFYIILSKQCKLNLRCYTEFQIKSLNTSNSPNLLACFLLMNMKSSFFIELMYVKNTPLKLSIEEWGWRLVHFYSFDWKFRKSMSCPNWQIKGKVGTVIFKEKQIPLCCSLLICGGVKTLPTHTSILFWSKTILLVGKKRRNFFT